MGQTLSLTHWRGCRRVADRVSRRTSWNVIEKLANQIEHVEVYTKSHISQAHLVANWSATELCRTVFITYGWLAAQNTAIILTPVCPGEEEKRGEKPFSLAFSLSLNHQAVLRQVFQNPIKNPINGPVNGLRLDADHGLLKRSSHRYWLLVTGNVESKASGMLDQYQSFASFKAFFSHGLWMQFSWLFGRE